MSRDKPYMVEETTLQYSRRLYCASLLLVCNLAPTRLGDIHAYRCLMSWVRLSSYAFAWFEFRVKIVVVSDCAWCTGVRRPI